MPHRPGTPGKTVFFEGPGLEKRTGHLTQREFVNAFAHARAGGVARGRHISMMTLVVVDCEMAIGRYREDDFSQ